MCEILYFKIVIKIFCLFIFLYRPLTKLALRERAGGQTLQNFQGRQRTFVLNMKDLVSNITNWQAIRNRQNLNRSELCTHLFYKKKNWISQFLRFIKLLTNFLFSLKIGYKRFFSRKWSSPEKFLIFLSFSKFLINWFLLKKGCTWLACDHLVNFLLHSLLLCYIMYTISSNFSFERWNN